jgi:hypothetical protein
MTTLNKLKFIVNMRFRHYYMGLGSFLVMAVWMLSDPDLGIINKLSFGVATLATFMLLLKAVLYVALLHVSRKALIDYIDLEKIFEKAMKSADGAGSAAVAIAITNVAIAILIYAAVH